MFAQLIWKGFPKASIIFELYETYLFVPCTDFPANRQRVSWDCVTPYQFIFIFEFLVAQKFVSFYFGKILVVLAV